MPVVEPLSNADFAGPEFLGLLREAVAVDDQALQATIATELPVLSVVGIREAGIVIAFAAFALSQEQLVLEYIAVEHRKRSAGYGRSLIQYVREQSPSKELFAETDDDAVEFYRRLGCSVSPAPIDLRWPERQRYGCVLPPLAR